MHGLKENRVKYILLSALFGLLVAVGFNPTLTFAGTINTVPTSVPTVWNPTEIEREGTVEPDIRIKIYDGDRIDSVGGDIFIYNDKDEVVAKDTYIKNTTNTYSQTHKLYIPLNELVTGKQTFKTQIISYNQDKSKKGESIVSEFTVDVRQKYLIKHVDQYTNKEIPVTGTYMPKKYVNNVGTDISTVILGTYYVTDTVNKKYYKYTGAYVGTEKLERSDNTTNLKFKHILTDNPDGEVITIYYQSDVPDYFYERGKVLETDYNKSDEMPIINREVKKDTAVPFNQRITLGPVDEKTGAPMSKSTVLGNGSASNTGSLFVNVMSEFTNGNYATSTFGSYLDVNNKYSTLSIYRPSVGTASNQIIYLDPNSTNYYYQKLSNGDEMIKVLSLAKPTFSDTNPDERYIVEYTLISSEQTNEVDVTAEVTNGTGSDRDLAIMYTTLISTNGAIAGTNMTTVGPIQALGDNKGISIIQAGRDPKYDVENAILFPDKTEDGPSNWVLGTTNLTNSYNGFNRGGTTNTVTGEGFEKGYTSAESKAAVGDDSLVDTPYKKGFAFNTKVSAAGNYRSLRMKTDVKNTKPNESVKLHWKVRFGDMKLEKDESSIYREMDKQSGEDLDDFELVNKVLPIEIDTNRISDATEVRNFMIFGNQNAGDTLSKITNTSRQNTPGSKINIDYRNEKVGLMFPRVITYNKNFDDIQPTSYSYFYETGGDDPIYGGSGFGLATFQDHKVENNVPANILNSSQIDEYYVSRDGHSAKAYGMYKFGTGKEIPIKVTVESANGKGKARMILEYMNTLDKQTNFNSFYTVHMDINNIHKSSEMKTLGDTKGVYFEEPDLSHLKGANYYVAFYTNNSNNGQPVDNINIYNIDDTGFTYPTNWNRIGGSETSHVPKFDPSQKKGERLKYRDPVTGAIKDSYPVHPGWYFSYASQELGKNDIGRADIELKVSDLDEIIYDPVKIIPEEDKEAHTKAELVYQPIIEQKMFEKMVSQGHKADNVEIVTTFNPYIDVKEEDLSVYADGALLDKNLYTLTIDKQKNEFKVLFKDPVPWDLKGKKVEIKQSSPVITNETTDGIMTYYDKPTKSFIFDITAFNSWDVHNDPTELREVQDPISKEKQIIEYSPTITAKAVEGLSVNSGDTPKAASEYVKDISQPDFAFDRYEAKFKDNKPPVFKGNGDVTFIVVVESKEFGSPIEVPVTVKVTEEVNMTVKYFLKTPTGATEKLVDLNDKDLKEINDKTKKVKVSDNFSDILKGYRDELVLGYDYLETVVKVDNQIETDHSKVPNKDFIVELYYDGKVMLDYPETFDFGSHQLSVLGESEIRPKITRDGNSDDKEMKMQVINTQGEGGIWKLSAKQSKEMKNGTDTFRGSIYYVPKPGAQAIELDNTFKKIEVDSQTNQIINRIPLLPKDLSTKAGIYIDINPGNKLGNYTNGEITWSLEDVL